jgi:hypothetical protein
MYIYIYIYIYTRRRPAGTKVVSVRT